MLGWWTIPRASGIGTLAELGAVLLWPFFRRYGGALEAPFGALSLLAGLCGLSILLMTGFDMLFHRRRGDRIRPVRAFDMVLGIGLVALSLLQLEDLRGQLPA